MQRLELWSLGSLADTIHDSKKNVFFWVGQGGQPNYLKKLCRDLKFGA